MSSLERRRLGRESRGRLPLWIANWISTFLTLYVAVLLEPLSFQRALPSIPPGRSNPNHEKLVCSLPKPFFVASVVGAVLCGPKAPI